jgi:hypothetical protein
MRRAGPRVRPCRCEYDFPGHGDRNLDIGKMQLSTTERRQQQEQRLRRLVPHARCQRLDSLAFSTHHHPHLQWPRAHVMLARFWGPIILRPPSLVSSSVATQGPGGRWPRRARPQAARARWRGSAAGKAA